jgi:hypothetical protein
MMPPRCTRRQVRARTAESQGRTTDFFEVAEKGLHCARYVPSDLVTYMTTTTTTNLLHQIAHIQLMERGKLSPYTIKDRALPASPYYKLQAWENGKNVTRYIRAEQVPLVEEALANYAKFQDLVGQYAQGVIDQTREQLAAVGVKKKPGRRPTSCWRRSRKSSN